MGRNLKWDGLVSPIILVPVEGNETIVGVGATAGAIPAAATGAHYSVSELRFG